MKIVNQSKKVVESIAEQNGLKYYITTMDMSSYIGFRSRAWYVTPPANWKTTKINIATKDNNLITSQEFLYDESGNVMRVIVEDSFGVKRVCQYYYDYENLTKVEDVEYYHGKGFCRENNKTGGCWVQNIIYKDGKQYYYDAKVGKFVTDKQENIEYNAQNNVNLSNFQYVYDMIQQCKIYDKEVENALKTSGVKQDN